MKRIEIYLKSKYIILTLLSLFILSCSSDSDNTQTPPDNPIGQDDDGADSDFETVDQTGLVDNEFFIESLALFEVRPDGVNLYRHLPAYKQHIPDRKCGWNT